MQFKQGAHVVSADGHDVGSLDRLIIQPRQQSVTDIVVRKGLLLPEDKLIPIHWVASTTENLITLDHNADDLKSLPPFEEAHYITADTEEVRRYDWSGDVVRLYWYPTMGSYPLVPFPAYPSITVERNTPTNTIALKEGTRVFTNDDEDVGSVARIFTTGSDRLEFFFVGHGLMPRLYKLIPTDWIEHIDEKAVKLSVSTRIINRLTEYERIPEHIDVQMNRTTRQETRRQNMATCGDIMTRKVVCAVPDDTIDNIAVLMKNNDVGPIPIVTDKMGNKLVGLVTDRDLVVKVLADRRNPLTTKVEQVMTRELFTCREDDNLDQALRVMEAHQVRRIPVVNNKQEIVGIIAQADIATQTQNAKKTAELVEEISKPESASASAGA